MADIHVLTGGAGKWQVVFHFPIADANNAVGVNWRTALVNSSLGGSTSLIEGTGDGQITTAEKAQVEAGELYEHNASFLIESGGTAAADLRAALREFYVQEETRIIARLQNQLRYFGHTESKT